MSFELPSPTRNLKASILYHGLQSIKGRSPYASQGHTATATPVNGVDITWKPTNSSVHAYPAECKTVAIRVLMNVLLLLRIAKWKVANANNEKFKRNMQLPYYKSVAMDSIQTELEAVLAETFPTASHTASFARTIIARLLAAHTVTAIIGALEEVDHLHTMGLRELGGERFATFTQDSAEEKKDAGFTFAVLSCPERLEISWPAEYGSDYLTAVMRYAQVLRNEQREPSFLDSVAFQFGYHTLSKGAPLPASEARFLGTVGFRTDAQTYLSLTDPGDGHVSGTTRKTRWMTGAIVHVEHLERPQNLPRSSIESYRIPSILDFAKVRLHTGRAAPNTYFVGRALRDSITRDFAYDFVKVVSTTSAAASAAFALGAAECKVAMDGLTTGQMVQYMQGLAGHVLRKPGRQYLSAAFNLNHPIMDDLMLGEDGQPRMLEGIMEIGLRGIELAALGGFDKVTWDGASDKYPSEPVIVQLGGKNALELVHRAHERGLTTYMSAGFKFHNVKDAVFAGVDGIGIGGAQILRYMDGGSGMHGPYTEENIDRIMVERNNAENSIRGQGVRLLARLDQMHFEGSLSEAEEKLREPLYQALYDCAEGDIYAMLFDNKDARAVMELPGDGEEPWVGCAERMLRHANPLLRKGAQNDEQWEGFVAALANLVDVKDEEGIQDFAQSEPWVGMRKGYRVSVGDGEKDFKGEPRVRVKTTPYGGYGSIGEGSDKVTVDTA